MPNWFGSHSSRCYATSFSHMLPMATKRQLRRFTFPVSPISDPLRNLKDSGQLGSNHEFSAHLLLNRKTSADNDARVCSSETTENEPDHSTQVDMEPFYQWWRRTYPCKLERLPELVAIICVIVFLFSLQSKRTPIFPSLGHSSSVHRFNSEQLTACQQQRQI